MTKVQELTSLVQAADLLLASGAPRSYLGGVFCTRQWAAGQLEAAQAEERERQVQAQDRANALALKERERQRAEERFNRPVTRLGSNEVIHLVRPGSMAAHA